LPHDQSFYDEMKRRRHPARRWHLAGNILHTASLFLGIAFVLAAVAAPDAIHRSALSKGHPPPGALAMLGATFTGVLVAVAVAFSLMMLGGWCTRCAYTLAERDGITA
jgi:hypothetical protein